MRRVIQRRDTVCACLLFVFVRLPGFGLDPAHAITQYAHTAWSRQEAPLLANVTALTQTRDGCLWIGTEFGMVQFDGIQFRKWQPSGGQLPSEIIGALRSSRDGSIWIGTREGLSHWTGHELVNYQTRTSATGPAVVAILEDRGGTIWAGTAGFQSGSLCRVNGGKLDCYSVRDQLPGPGISTVLEDSEGNVWAAGRGGISRWRGNDRAFYALKNPADIVYSVAQHAGEIVLATAGKDPLQRFDKNGFAPYALKTGTQNIHPAVLLFDRDGGLWIGTVGQGLLHVGPGGTDQFTHSDGLSDDYIHSLFEDREGNIWAGTEKGLDRFRDLPVTTITKREGLAGTIAGSVAASRSGGVWIGTNNGLNYIDGGKLTGYTKADGLPSASITGIFEDAAGRLWVDTSEGIAYEENGKFHRLEVSLPQRVRSMAAVAEDREHTLWISDPAQGLIHFKNGDLMETAPLSEFGNKQVWALAADRNTDGLWAGFAEGGIAYFAGGELVRSYDQKQGLPDGAIADLYEDRNGALWIAAAGGLSVFRRGKFQTLSAANGLPCDSIEALIFDDAGALWLNTACGLVSIAAPELNGWLKNPGTRLRVKCLNSGDGMITHAKISGFFRSAVKSKDGRLWFAVIDGVAVVDPKHLPHNSLPPPVEIEKVMVNGVAQAPGSKLRLPSSTKDIEIDYTAFSFVNPDRVSFRHKLGADDGEWQDAGQRREASFSNLLPGKYRFQVIASNNDDVWNNTGAFVEFTIEPKFYQTKLFLFLCLSALAMLLWSVYKLRVRQLAARMRLLYEAQLSERTRIASDLHDDLLQNIAGFALQLDLLSKTMVEPAKLKDRLRELREQVEHWSNDARETVWDLRHPRAAGQPFLERLRESIQETIRGKAIRLEISSEGESRPLDPKMEETLVRIVREAARNAVRHAKPKEIKLVVDYEKATTLRISMEDDGCGFTEEEASLKRGHWGLAVMQHRARQVGAELLVSSTPGKGTHLDLEVPLRSRRN